MRQHTPRFDASNPMLIFKVGILGTCPLDFPEALAEDMDAQFLSSDRIRLEIADSISDFRHHPNYLRAIRSTIMDRALPMLEKGDDVVLDMFFNTRKSRVFPIEMAEMALASSVVLDIHAPFATALERVEIWTAEDAFEIPASEWNVPPIAVAKGMMGHIQRPRDEGIDYLFRIDGSADTASMIGETYEHLERHGLIDEA